uniref:DNA replication licensing factor MCM6 n=1 Tax=Dermatophagoides pteronyssinus TaxID=6956 RepID=A0A6P6YIW1_DERPT
LKSLRSDDINQLVSLHAVVTRSTEVRPELLSASYKCEVCGFLNADVRQQFRYTYPIKCGNGQCANRTRWALQQETCRLIEWQRLRVQQPPEDREESHAVPQSMHVVVRGPFVNKCRSGETVRFTGYLIAVPDIAALIQANSLPHSVNREKTKEMNNELGAMQEGLHGISRLGVRELTYKLVFVAQNVQVVNSAFSANRFRKLCSCYNLLDQLAEFTAPHVYGCEACKKGILCLLVSGVEKYTAQDNIRLRGDINICLVGDPGTAKSQLLKWVESFADLVVYANGKSSTAAGLTASVHKDRETGESVIEAGALILADGGICCIDEFDKMNVKDRVAIHEAMEQQTISIAKAAIHATMNARARVLAACSPAEGRYNTARTLRENLALSPALLSRFDLVFVMLDANKVEEDAAIAAHIVKLARHDNVLPANEYLRDEADFKFYIAVASAFNPRLTPEAKQVLLHNFVNVRQRTALSNARNQSRLTTRQLESTMRIAEAIAKLHFSVWVTQFHAECAIDLFRSRES